MKCNLRVLFNGIDGSLQVLLKGRHRAHSWGFETLPFLLWPTILDACESLMILKGAGKFVSDTGVLIMKFLRENDHSLGFEFVGLFWLHAWYCRDLQVGGESMQLLEKELMHGMLMVMFLITLIQTATTLCIHVHVHDVFIRIMKTLEKRKNIQPLV